MTYPWLIDNNCVKYYSDQTLQWGVMAWQRIFGMCVLWPWPWIYYLGSRSWHTLRSGTTILEISSRSDKGIRSYGPDTMWTDGRTDIRIDRRTDRVIPIFTSYFVYEGINMSARRGAQLVPIGIPTICWKTFPEKRRKCSFRETQASC